MTCNSKLLEGKIAVITGCNRGIGLATLELFLEHGATVYAVARTADSLIQFKDIPACIPVYMDITESVNVKTLFTRIQKESKRLDILVNNAGVMEDALIGMISKARIENTYAVNVFAVIDMIQYATKFFSRQKSGSIINLASIMGTNGNRGQALYGSSKGAVIAFTKAASKELAPLGIRVNAIAPGAIDTDLLRAEGEENIETVLQHINFGRLGTPKEVAQTALFLASDLSEYVTGQIIGVDGSMIV